MRRAYIGQIFCGACITFWVEGKEYCDVCFNTRRDAVPIVELLDA